MPHRNVSALHTEAQSASPRLLRSPPSLDVQAWRASESVFLVRAPATPPGKPRAYGVRCGGPGAADALAAAVESALEAQRDTVGLQSKLSCLQLPWLPRPAATCTSCCKFRLSVDQQDAGGVCGRAASLAAKQTRALRTCTSGVRMPWTITTSPSEFGARANP